MKAPEKELRFTRSGQAVTFFLTGLGLTLAGLAVLLLERQILDNAPPRWIAWPLLGLGAVAFWFAHWLNRHAFLLLSPVGLEIFPFYRPITNFQLVPWGTVVDAAVSDDLRWLTVDLIGDSKIFISLAPLARHRRPLLQRAIHGLMEKRAEASRPAADPPGEAPDAASGG